jgi:phage-related protein
VKPFEFTFRGKSCLDFGLYGAGFDIILPPKRARKQMIPFRDGAYDYGAQWYDERTLRLVCIWANNKLENLTRADIREISYWLSPKGHLVLAIEPDKYYNCALYNAADLEAHYNFADEIRTTDGKFTLDFICDPFAYGDTVSCPITSGNNVIAYQGTARSPCTIILKNTGTTSVSNIQIVTTKRQVL